ncbi:50S ribosomal protein L11 methyltransferase [Arhodomonas aquaeolei]|uniref:50S ribosomal protein L11 methyltransferase n=1 Tax=Arhodomonas TaxID=2368 RepID=UPI000368869C|nr:MULTISPECIES: 50S ribosomal protein L11 methyltransferase [Arhodomonas]MCS4503460.1 50S ribosomal protein L11 methyltransferase [Arhodomonas aquaeolei]
MAWIEISFELPRERFGLAEAVLEAAGALSVTGRDPGDEPVLEPAPGEQRLWSRVRVTGLFDADVDPAAVRASAREALGAEPAEWHVGSLEDRAWERAWMDDYRPMRFGERLWVVPSHEAPPDPDALNLRLDPGLAFGTGTHPTTALCLEALDARPPVGERVLDYGCGSGVLAIAALLLGAREAEGVDNDPQALVATRENARANGVAERLAVRDHTGEPPAPADCVVANILSGVLIELAPVLVRCCRPGGRLVLSGVLAGQAASVAEAFRPEVTLEVSAPRDGWVRLEGKRGPG